MSAAQSLAVNLTNALKIQKIEKAVPAANFSKVAKNYLEHFAKSVMLGGLIFHLVCGLSDKALFLFIDHIYLFQIVSAINKSSTINL